MASVLLLLSLVVTWVSLSWAQPAQLINGNRTHAGATNYGVTTGTGTAYVLTLNAAIPGYVNGSCYLMQAHTANTGAASLNVNGRGARVLKKKVGAVLVDLEANDIIAGQLVEACTDGTVMQTDLGVPTGGTGGHTIKDETTTLPAQPILTFLGTGVSCSNNGGATATECTIPGGAAGSVDVSGTPSAGELAVFVDANTVQGQTTLSLNYAASHVSTSGTVSTGTEYVTTGASTVTRTLPAAVSGTSTKRFLVLKEDSGAGTLTLAPFSGQTINGAAASLSTTTQWAGWLVNETSATNWVAHPVATTPGGGGGAPTDAQYWTARAEPGLAAEVNLGALTSGLVKHTVSGGVSTPATAVAGTDYQAPVTWGAGLTASANTAATASQEANFLADGGATNLTCGVGTQGKMQVMDNGTLQYCDGAATALLKSGLLTQTGLTWAVTAATCTGDGNAGKLTVDLSNQIICAADQGGAGGGGDILAVGSCATGDCFTAATPAASLVFNNATSGNVTLQTVAGALGTRTVSLPAETGTVCTTGSVCAGYQASLGTTAALQVGSLGLGEAANATVGTLETTAGANNTTLLRLKRFTDTAPTGNFVELHNAAGASLWTIDITGSLTVGSVPLPRVTGTLAELNTAVTDANLLPDPGANGLVARTGATTTVNRTLTAAAGNNITVTNGNGVAGNPTIDVGANVAKLDTANLWADGIKQTFNPSPTTAGLNVGSQAGDPSTPANGDLWYDSNANELTARINGVNVSLGVGTSIANGTAGSLTYYTGTNSLAPSTAQTLNATHLLTSNERVTPMNADLTLSASHGPIIACTAGAINRTATLPNAATATQSRFVLVKVDNGVGTCILAPATGERINGVVNGTKAATTENGAVEARLVNTATPNWHVMSAPTTINLATDVSGTLAGSSVTPASETVVGTVELATAAETSTGTDATRAVSPDALAGSVFGTKYAVIECVPDATALTTGDGKCYLPIPPGLNGWVLVAVSAHVGAAVSSSGAVNVDIDRCGAVATGIRCSGTNVDMLSTNLTIDANEDGTETAAAAAVINTANDDLATGQWLRFNVDAAGTGTQGLYFTLGFQKP